MTQPQPSSQSGSTQVTVGFAGSMLLPYRYSEFAIWVDRTPATMPVSIRDVNVVDRVFPLPLPGRGWRRQFYFSLCWWLGRKGRGR